MTFFHRFFLYQGFPKYGFSSDLNFTALDSSYLPLYLRRSHLSSLLVLASEDDPITSFPDHTQVLVLLHITLLVLATKVFFLLQISFHQLPPSPPPALPFSSTHHPYGSILKHDVRVFKSKETMVFGN